MYLLSRHEDYKIFADQPPVFAPRSFGDDDALRHPDSV
jgi:hypothetical protein